MTVLPTLRPVTHGRVLRIALPVVLSNATVPLQGAIDTAIIGNLGDEVYLAAVVLGASALALLFASFNFLQMGVSGLTAQALGRGDGRRVVNTLARALLLAGAIALLLNLGREVLIGGVLALFRGSAGAEALAGDYIGIRLWGAPVELANYALIGWFAGQEQTRRLFEMQIVISLANIVLNLVFVLGLGWGVEGVALGTVLAQALGTGLGLWRVRARIAVLVPEGWRLERRRLLDPVELVEVMRLNRDIFIRTLCISACFAWFARLGSAEGDVVLAANGVLMQFLLLSSNALDGFAMATETLVGQALGARSRSHLRRAVVVSTVSALWLAAGFAVVATLAAPAVIALFTNVAEVRAVAEAHAPWATLMPLAGVLAFQLDGVFIGAAEGRAMRNAMIVAAAVFLPLGWLMTQGFGNHGLWAALWVWMLLRSVTLLLRYPALEARAG